MVQLASHASSAYDQENEDNVPQRAKRIARPAHWKQSVTHAARTAKTNAAQKPAPAAQAVIAQPQPSTTPVERNEWRTDPNFIMRTLACICVLNFLLFTLFPDNPLNTPMSDETFMATGERSILPSQSGAHEIPTVYAPVQRAEPQPKIVDGLRAPRWLRGSAH